MKANVLKGKIVERGMTIGVFCERTGFSRSTFDRISTATRSAGSLMCCIFRGTKRATFFLPSRLRKAVTGKEGRW